MSLNAVRHEWNDMNGPPPCDKQHGLRRDHYWELVDEYNCSLSSKTHTFHCTQCKWNMMATHNTDATVPTLFKFWRYDDK